MGTNYEAGRRFEWERKAAWEALGFTVARSAGSHSPWDLTARRHDGVTLIQCKYTEDSTEPAHLIRVFKETTIPIGGVHQCIEVRVRGKKEIHSVTI